MRRLQKSMLVAGAAIMLIAGAASAQNRFQFDAMPMTEKIICNRPADNGAYVSVTQCKKALCSEISGEFSCKEQKSELGAALKSDTAPKNASIGSILAYHLLNG